MELLFYIVIAWFVVTCFATTLPKSCLVKNIILYMLLLILTVSISTEIFLNLKLVNFTKDRTKFVAVILCRNIVTPLLLVIYADIFNRLKSYAKKITLTVMIIAFSSTLELTNLQLGLYIFVKWNFIYYLLLYIFYIFIAVVLDRGLLAWQRRSEQNK